MTASETNGRTVVHWKGRTGGHGKVYVALHYNAFVLKWLKHGFWKRLLVMENASVEKRVYKDAAEREWS